MPVSRGRGRTALVKLTGDFTLERTKPVITRRRQDEMLLAQARDELILKSLVEKQATFLCDALRKKIMSVPQTFTERATNLTDVNQAQRMLKELSIALLNELRDLPAKVVDTNWLKKL